MHVWHTPASLWATVGGWNTCFLSCTYFLVCYREEWDLLCFSSTAWTTQPFSPYWIRLVSCWYSLLCLLKLIQLSWMQVARTNFTFCVRDANEISNSMTDLYRPMVVKLVDSKGSKGPMIVEFVRVILPLSTLFFIPSLAARSFLFVSCLLAEASSVC